MRAMLLALALALSVSPALAATVEVTIDKLVFSPASVQAKVRIFIGFRRDLKRELA